MLNREKNISAQQALPQNDTRLPRSHGDCQRPQDHQSPSQTGTEGIDSRLTFPKNRRLLKRVEFRAFARNGIRYVGRYIVVDVKPARDRIRLGITVTKKYGNSPERNRFKRIIRESFRLSYSQLPQKVDILVRPRSFARTAKMQDIKHELLSLLS